LAAWLCENSCADKAFFCNSGAESNEAAIKLARRHASNRGITVSRVIIFVVGSGNIRRTGQREIARALFDFL